MLILSTVIYNFVDTYHHLPAEGNRTWSIAVELVYSSPGLADGDRFQVALWIRTLLSSPFKYSYIKHVFVGIKS